jgi:hypothetical protein
MDILKPQQPQPQPQPQPQNQYKEPDQLCKLGNKREEHQPDGIWELVLSNFISPIDPKKYFVTSGEAVQKAKKLEEDIWSLAGKARSLRKLLEKARSPAVYLETEWMDGSRLILKRKNPRKHKLDADTK